MPWAAWSLKNVHYSQYIHLADIHLLLNDNFLEQAFVSLEQKGLWVVALALLGSGLMLHILAYHSEPVFVVGVVAASAADAVVPLEITG